MTTDTRRNPRARLGRPVRPTAFGLMIISGALGVGSFLGHSLLRGQLFGQIIAVLCALAAAFYIAGFVSNRAWSARAGDLLVFFSFATQTAFLWIETPDFLYRMIHLAPGSISAWVGIGLMVISAGAFRLNGRLE